jgi:protein TonB
VPGFRFSLEKPNWVEVSVVTFPDMKERMPEWTPGSKAVPQPEAEVPKIEKTELPVPETTLGIPVEPADPELPDFVEREDNFFTRAEFRKVIPGRKEKKGVLEGEGQDKTMVITGPVSKRKLIRRVDPKYPAWAEEKGIEGEAELKFWVSPEGMVTSVELARTSGYPDFDSRAMAAVKKYLFAPLSKGEEQEVQWGKITIKYTFLK